MIYHNFTLFKWNTLFTDHVNILELLNYINYNVQISTSNSYSINLKDWGYEQARRATFVSTHLCCIRSALSVILMRDCRQPFYSPMLLRPLKWFSPTLSRCSYVVIQLWAVSYGINNPCSDTLSITDPRWSFRERTIAKKWLTGVSFANLGNASY